MKSPNSKLVFTAMLGACLFACNPPSDTVDTSKDADPVPETGSAFDRSALAIKATQTSQKEKITAMEALASRYGRIAAPQASPGPDPVFREAERPEAGALGKTALVTRWNWMKVREFNNNFALMIVRLVKPNQTITAWTTRPEGSTADPFLVATYNTETVGRTYLTKVVGLNDDHTGLDSRFSWKNLTGSDKWIQIVAFPFAPGLSGDVALSSMVNGLNRQSVSDYMDGFAVYDNSFTTTPIPGCTGPLSERLSLFTDPPGDFTYGAMMVNAETMTGALIYNGGGLREQTINLPTPTPSGYPNMMLVFATSKVLGGGPEGRSIALQEQKFSCNN